MGILPKGQVEKGKGIRVSKDRKLGDNMNFVGMEALNDANRQVYKHKERRHVREVHLGERENRGKRCDQTARNNYSSSLFSNEPN